MEPDNVAEKQAEYVNKPQTVISLSESSFVSQEQIKLREDLVETARLIAAERESRQLSHFKIAIPNETAWCTYFVPGSCTTRIDQEIQADWTSRASGRRFLLIENDRERNCVVDYFNSGLGLFSSRCGAWAEPDAVDILLNSFEQDLRNHRQIKIVAHSQGGIITHNVTSLLSRRHGYGWWNKHAEQVEVVCYGSSIRRWARGMDVTVYQQDSDYPAWLVGTTSGAATGIKSLLGREYSEAKIVSISGNEHRFYSYMVKLAPEFFLQRHIDNNGGLVKGNVLAGDLVRSIQKKEQSDETHRKLIDIGIRSGGETFSRELAKTLTEKNTNSFNTHSGNSKEYHILDLEIGKRHGEFLMRFKD